MSDEKILSIQEKIYAERQKVQEKLQKNVKITQNIEEKQQKEEIYPINIEETKNLIEKSIYNRNFDDRISDRHETDYSSSFPASSLMTGIMILIVGFTLLTMGNFVTSSIAQSITLAEPATETPSYISNVIEYATTIMPLFGLVLLVVGFAAILVILRPAMDDYR